MPRPSKLLVALAAMAAGLCAGVAAAQPPRLGDGQVEVLGGRLFRDGRLWVPHGFYQIAFEVAPGDLARADHPFWATAQQNYSPEEYRRMREAGADSVRIQIAQLGADPQSPLYDAGFVERALGAVRAARAAGLSVIISIQGESHVPGETPLALPGPGTRRIWAAFAPRFAEDRGVMFELLNEPQPPPSPANWAQWKAAMEETLAVVRRSGARNVVIADGLDKGQVLDGAPLLDDPQVAYASHPYANQQFGQTAAAWERKFGAFSRRAPVIITEWLFGGYFCNADTPDATLRFLRYIQARDIGLMASIWDWAPAGFGSVRWDFPQGKFSSFAGLSCHQPGYGYGQIIEQLYGAGFLPPLPR